MGSYGNIPYARQQCRRSPTLSAVGQGVQGSVHIHSQTAAVHVALQHSKHTSPPSLHAELTFLLCGALLRPFASVHHPLHVALGNNLSCRRCCGCCCAGSAWQHANARLALHELRLLAGILVLLLLLPFPGSLSSCYPPLFRFSLLQSAPAGRWKCKAQHHGRGSMF